jgi:hypothetical protein
MKRRKEDTIWLGSICRETIIMTSHAHAHVLKVARMMSDCRMEHIFFEGYDEVHSWKQQ